ncbi:lytic murein transglycosylase [Phytohabitans sp. ZYX-F-186]|uniref:Lytic murein transglycosylase n=1 Tax=Phytohabitans maris TaxID=3071409 RepID=A0ABU0ZI57_9ACTN|nr:lytic murein transglycosylase [Phytohabitans sp. ZYX-F-186]MDQ7906738.1 lytic murein transglycosylase [Phytohabitans sp. ZYX-F-186]
MAGADQPAATVDKPAAAESPTAIVDKPAVTAESPVPAAEKTAEKPAPEQRGPEPESEWARPPETPPVPAADATTPATDAPTVTVAAASAAVPETPPGPRRRVRFAHAFRGAPRARDVARDGRAWSGRPSGRLTLPAVLLLVLVVGGVVAGAVAFPLTAGSRKAAPDPTASGEAAPTFPEGLAPLPSTGAPVEGGTPSPGATGTTGPAVVGRPADVLAAWANQTGGKLDIPWVAMQAYGYAELVIARTRPQCSLKWTTLAAIGKIESNHGRHNATLGIDGASSPRILGPVLDGTGDTQRIDDTDDGVLDGDLLYDRAVGAMQFIPSTWKQHEVDADNDGLKDVNDIDDAALAAGNYLCQGGRNMDLANDWWNAILSYNDVRRYAQDVFDAANDYGSRSRT